MKNPVLTLFAASTCVSGSWAQAPMKDVFDYFEASTNSHSYVNAYLLAALSYFVYGATPNQSWSAFQTEFKDRFTLWGVQEFDFFRNASNGTEGVVVTTKNAVIVVFRGTETKGNRYFRNSPALWQEDWVTDMIFTLTPVPGWGTNVRVHTGFHNAMNSVYQSMSTAVQNRATGGRTVWLTGHSLGAALATLSAYRLQKLGGVTVKGVYTFGSPRIGNAYFADEYNQILQNRTHRWAAFGDAITMLPPAHPGALTGYRHVGRTNNVNSNDSLSLNAHEFSMPPNGPIPGRHDIVRYMWKIHAGMTSPQRQKVHAPIIFGLPPAL